MALTASNISSVSNSVSYNPAKFVYFVKPGLVKTNLRSLANKIGYQAKFDTQIPSNCDWPQDISENLKGDSGEDVLETYAEIYNLKAVFKGNVAQFFYVGNYDSFNSCAG